MMAAISMHSAKVAVVGTGLVGATFAYALAIRGPARELGLTDLDRDRAEGEAMDLRQGLSLVGPMAISAGGYEQCAGAAVVVITAGAPQRKGQSRLELAGQNAEIMRKIVPQVLEHNPDPIFLVVTNPVDVLTQVVWRASGLSHQRVIGSGTVLDSARFRYMLSANCAVDPRNVHAYVIGEHGDSEVLMWDEANIGGVPLKDRCPVCARSCGQAQRQALDASVRNAAYEIIQRKGATYYAVGLALQRIVEAILLDQHSVLTVSTRAQGRYGLGEVTLSLPCVVGAAGVEDVITPELSPDEAAALADSGQALGQVLDQVGA